MKASDLSYDAKQQILNQVRAQVGTGQYDQMVAALGEDGVIDLVLGQAQETSKSRSKNEQLSCWDSVWIGVALLFAYSIGLSMLGENRQLWHYLAAIPLGLLYAWLMWCGGLWFVLVYLTLPVGGVLLVIWFISAGLHLWLSGAGLVYLGVGAFCASRANREMSTPWALNSRMAYILGLIMIAIGITVHFINM